MDAEAEDLLSALGVRSLELSSSSFFVLPGTERSVSGVLHVHSAHGHFSACLALVCWLCASLFDTVRNKSREN